MVKIRLLDDREAPVEEEAFLALERHGDGFAVVLLNTDGDKVIAPFVLFLEPNSVGRLTLSLAASPNGDYVDRSNITNAIQVNLAH